MSLNNGKNCNSAAIPRLFFTPLSPNPPPIPLPENTLNIPIMEFLVPAQAVAGGTARVQLDSTISTEVFVETEVVDLF